MKSSFKTDKYRKNRGGSSRWYSLHCEVCRQTKLIYQKDGSGILKRLYIDRIFAPKHVDGSRNLLCEKCDIVLGIPTVYKKEDRPAIRLFAGAIGKTMLRTDQLEKVAAKL